MTKLIELWDRDGEYKTSINPDHIIDMRPLREDEDENGGTVIYLIEERSLVVTDSYEDIRKAIQEL